MQYRPPAAVDDWNCSAEKIRLAGDWDTFISDQVSSYSSNTNYFDLKQQPPPPLRNVQVPWNGFPLALDKFCDAEAQPTPENRARAESIADVLRPCGVLRVIQPRGFRDFWVGLDVIATYRQMNHPFGRAEPLHVGNDDVPLIYRQQDEYLEWHTERDAAGKITRITFTAEPPEYWNQLAVRDEELIATLYRDLIGQQVVKEELFFAADVTVMAFNTTSRTFGRVPYAKKGDYNDHNRWNTTHGAVHLTHPANTLGAEINLAAIASLFSTSDDAQPAPPFQTKAEARIGCAGYGEINRNSDPTIGATVGDQISIGRSISLSDPVGLYIVDVALAGLKRASGASVGDSALNVVRPRPPIDQDAPRIVRLEITAPAGADFVLGDCMFDNRPLKRAGQIARRITMGLYVDAKNQQLTQERNGCGDSLWCRHPQHPGFFGGFDADVTPDCSKVTADLWRTQIPFDGSGAHLDDVILTMAAERPAAVAAVATVQELTNSLVGMKPIYSRKASL